MPRYSALNLLREGLRGHKGWGKAWRSPAPKSSYDVIIIGGGHTEYGLGVVDRLSIIDPDISQVNIALKEIRINPAPLSDYLTPLTLEGHDLMLPADFLRFSQRVSYENPCEAFKEQLKKMKARPKE